ncbi:MAG: arsenate reductase (glutaredoxin) [Methylohalobius sp.]
MAIVFYHNPRCSKSRAALQLLRERGIEPTVVEYLKTPPSRAELEAILTKLGFEPRQLMRKQEKSYQELGLDDPALSREALISAMLEHPILIERPIAVAGDRAVVGRPPENVLRLL